MREKSLMGSFSIAFKSALMMACLTKLRIFCTCSFELILLVDDEPYIENIYFKGLLMSDYCLDSEDC